MTLKTWTLTGPPGVDVTVANSGLSVVNRDGGVIKFVAPTGVQFITDADGSFTIARGLTTAVNNAASFLGRFTAPPAPGVNLDIGRIRHNAAETAVIKFVITPALELQLWDTTNGLISGDGLAFLTAGLDYQLSIVVSISGDYMIGQLYDAGGFPIGNQVSSADLPVTTGPIEGFEIGVSSQNAATEVVWRKVQMDDGSSSEIPPDLAPQPDRASANCEVWIDGAPLACTPGDLGNGLPTVLSPLTITWGRDSAWDQPGAGSASFQIQDQRTAPVPIVDTIHVGSKVDVYASAPNPNPNPEPELVFNQDFETTTTGAGGRLNDSQWVIGQYPLQDRRRNRALDPAFTTTSGKTAGGSATLAIVNVGGANPTYLTITPNGVSSASAVYPLGGTGMTAFEVNKTYTVSMYYRLNVVQTGTLDPNARKIRLHLDTGSGFTVTATSAQGPNTAIAGFTRLSLTFTVPANAVGCVVSMCNGSSVAGQVMHVDNLLIEEGTALQAYFDGGTTDTASYDYVWTGTVNASHSVERYTATHPDSAPFVYDAGGGFGSVGQGVRSAHLASAGTHAQFRFNPGVRIPSRAWNTNWPRVFRATRPGEVWAYSVMIRIPAGTSVIIRIYGYSTSETGPSAGSMILDGAGTSRTITAANSDWITYSGTFTNTAAVGFWPIFAIETFPNNTDVINPAIDAIRFTAPAQTEIDAYVWAGRVSDLQIVRGGNPTAVTIGVTAVGEITEVENVSVGDTPWLSETITNRIDRIVSLIPVPVSDFSVSRDSLDFVFVTPRDVDSQPALGLLREFAAMTSAICWPVASFGARNHVWIERTSRRLAPLWDGTRETISACTMDAEAIAIGQSSDKVITISEVSWIDIGIDPDPDVERVASIVDITGAELYGTNSYRVNTQLMNENDALGLAQDVIDQATASSWSVSGMTFDTRWVDNTDGNAQILLMTLLDSAQRPATLLTITDLPEWFPVEIGQGFVEGGTIEYVDGAWRFDLTISSKAAA